MPPAILIDLGLKTVRLPRGGAFVGYIADRAGHPGTSAIAAVRAVPWTSGMVLTNPSGIGAEDALHRSHQAQRQHELRAVDGVMATDYETVVTALLEGQYKNPMGIFAFNTAEGWARDVSADIAAELRRRCDLATARRAVRSTGLRRSTNFVDRPGSSWIDALQTPERTGDSSRVGVIRS